MGDPDDPPVLLVMGLGAQLLLWRKEFCEKLVDQGLRVIRYDNRDVGLSSKLHGQRTERPLVPQHGPIVPRRAQSPAVYTLEDMADDAAALLDHLGIDRAHIVGASMGGMIAQVFAARHPAAHQDARRHLLAATTSRCCRRRDRSSCCAVAAAARRRTRRARSIVENAIRVSRIIGSPGYPPPEEKLRADAIESYDRAYYPAGHRPALRRDHSAAAACCTTTGRSPRRPS